MKQDLTKQVERLSHLQQRIGNLASVMQARGITSWVIIALIAGIYQTQIRAVLGDSPISWLAQIEYTLAFNSSLLALLGVFGVLNETLRGKKSLAVIIPPRLLTLHFTMNELSEVLAFANLGLIISAMYLGTQLSFFWMWYCVVVSCILVYSNLKQSKKNNAAEIFPGLHPHSLKYLYRKSGVLRKLWPSVLVYVFLVILIMPFVALMPVWIKNAGINKVGSYFLSPMTFYLIIVAGLLSYIFVRESSFREMRSIISLQRLLEDDPLISDEEFGFFLRATYDFAPSSIYCKFVNSYMDNRFQKIRNQSNEFSKQLAEALKETESKASITRIETAVRDLELQILVFIEKSTQLAYWIRQHAIFGETSDWNDLLKRELERAEAIQGVLKTFSNPVLQR